MYNFRSTYFIEIFDDFFFAYSKIKNISTEKLTLPDQSIDKLKESITLLI